MSKSACPQPWLHLVCAGATVPPNAVLLADGDNRAALTAMIAALPVGSGTRLCDNPLASVTGFAGLEELAVWVRAAYQYRATGVAVAIRIGADRAEQYTWLRRLCRPSELTELLDVVSPPLVRHRDMPPVFGAAAQRAHAIDGLCRRCRAFHSLVTGGEVVVHPGPEDRTVAAVATWLGIAINPPVATMRDARLRVSHQGSDSTGALRFHARVAVPAGIVSGPLSIDNIEVSVHGEHAIIGIDGWRRRFMLPAILHACDYIGLQVSLPAVAPGAVGTDVSGTVVLEFRSVAGLLPRTQ